MARLSFCILLSLLTVAFAISVEHHHNQVVCPIYKAYDPFVTPNATYTNPNHGPANTLWTRVLSSRFGYKFIYNNPQLLQEYADDYGHIVHEVPKAVFRPHSTDDVVEFVKIVKRLSQGRHKLQIVLRGSSGNVQGAAQADTSEILVDFSCGMNDIQVNANKKTVWAEAGALWEDVRAAAYNVGLRPYIMPDYLGITIGGTASIGGLGPETPFYGSTADNILELEVVTLNGEKIRASPNKNALIFTAARGGMGNFFLITRVQYRLKELKPNTRIFHVLTPHYQAAITDIIRFVKSNQIYLDGVQMFLSQNDLTSFVISVGEQILNPSLAPSVDAVLATNQTWVYVMELTIRYDDVSPLNVTDIQNVLSPVIDKHLVFSTDYTTEVWDRRLYLFTIPALIQIGNWYKRHPWLNVFFSERSARHVLPSLINPMNPIQETGGGHVSLYPYPRSVFTSPFISVPQDDFVFLMVVGRDEISGTPEGLQFMQQSNRHIWNTLKAAGHATLYPTNDIPDFDANDWREHFGPRVWEEYKLVKKLLDPKFLLADKRNFGFAQSVY